MRTRRTITTSIYSDFFLSVSQLLIAMNLALKPSENSETYINTTFVKFYFVWSQFDSVQVSFIVVFCVNTIT